MMSAMNETAVPDCSKQIPKPWLFQPGQSGNPAGRPHGAGGRQRALQILDEVGNRQDNAQLLAEAMDKAMKQNPLKFFMQVMAPLLPKEALLRVENKAASVGPWVTLVEVARFREIERRAQAAGIELPPPAVLHHRNGGPRPERDEADTPPPFWPSPPRPPGALPAITAREPGAD